MQYWMYAGPTNALGCLNLTLGYMTILQYQFGAQHQSIPEQQLILDDLHETRLRMNYDLAWIHHTIYKHWSLMELHRQKLN